VGASLDLGKEVWGSYAATGNVWNQRMGNERVKGTHYWWRMGPLEVGTGTKKQRARRMCKAIFKKGGDLRGGKFAKKSKVQKRPLNGTSAGTELRASFIVLPLRVF